jgi:hypothetical protein
MNDQIRHHETDVNNQGELGDELLRFSMLITDRRHQMPRTYAYFVHVNLIQHPHSFQMLRRAEFQQRQLALGGRQSGPAL